LTWPKPEFSRDGGETDRTWWFSGVSLEHDLAEQRFVVATQLALGGRSFEYPKMSSAVRAGT